MALKANSEDAKALRHLIPISSLADSDYERLCSEVCCEDTRKGAYLFREGDKQNEFVYLLRGRIGLQSNGAEADTVVAGSETARFALAHQLPRKVSAIAKSKVRFVRVDARLLNAFHEKREDPLTFEVGDLEEECGGDWMTALLQMQLFQKLPAENLQKLLMSLEAISLNAGTTVIGQDEQNQYCYILKTGLCTVMRRPSPQTKEIKLGEYRDGDIFGEESLITEHTHNVRVTMATDGVLLRLGKTEFLKLIKEPVVRSIDLKTAQLEIARGAGWLDIRSPDAFEVNHIEGSVNVPFFSLRLKLEHLNRRQKQIVVCDNRKFSEAAAFMLIRYGFDAFVLKDAYCGEPAPSLKRDALPVQTYASVLPASGEQEVSRAFAEAKTAGETKQCAVQRTGQAPQECEAGPQAQQTISGLQSRLSSRMQDLKSAEQMAIALRFEKSELARQNQELEAKLKTSGNECAAVRREAEERRQELEAVNLTLDRMRKESEALREAAARSEHRSSHELERVNGELVAAKCEVEGLREKLRSVESDRDRLRVDKREYAAKLTEALSPNSGVNTELEELRKLLDARDRELEENAKNFEHKLEELSAQTTGLKSRVDALQAETTELNEQLSQKTEALAQEKAKVGAIREEKAALENELRVHRFAPERHADETEKVNASKGEINRLKKQTARLENEKKAAQEEAASFCQQVQELKAVIQEFVEEIENPQESFEVRSLRRELEMVRSQATSDVETLQAQLEQVQAESVRLTDSLKQERRRLSELQYIIQSNPALAAKADGVDASENGGKDANAPIAGEARSNTRPRLWRTLGLLFSLTAGLGLLASSDTARRFFGPHLFDKVDRMPSTSGAPASAGMYGAIAEK